MGESKGKLKVQNMRCFSSHTYLKAIGHSTLLEIFKYDPDIGSLTLLLDASNPVKPNKYGSPLVRVKGRKITAFKLAWFLHYGEPFEGKISPLDGDSKNLKLSNLSTKVSRAAPPSSEVLKKRYNYNPITGVVTRIEVNPNRKTDTGKERGVFRKTDSRTQMNLLGFKKLTTHFIWCYMTGEYPPPHLFIDHIDRDVTNNRWNNLRMVTKQQNCSNMSQVKRETLYLRGVVRTDTGKLRAKCSFERKQYLGPSRLTQEEAHQDYIELHKKLHGEFSNYKTV